MAKQQTAPSRKNPVLARDYGKIPPQALDLEEAVLGAIMLEKDAILSVLDILEPGSFYKEANQQIYEMAQKLSMELGLGVGISSGANFLGALEVQEELGEDAVVVTVFSDDNKKYLSTDLLREEEVKEGFHSPHIKLTGFKAFKRVCHTCCDPDNCVEVDYKGETKAFCLPKCTRR